MAISTGQINKTFVSAIDPMLDTREIYKKVTDTPNEGFLTDQLIAAGYKRPVTQYSYHNFEAETVFSSLVVSSGFRQWDGYCNIQYISRYSRASKGG